MIKTAPDGVEILLKVVPKSSRDRIAGSTGGRLRVCVTAAPERGKANAAVIELIAIALGVPRSAVAIVAWQAGPRKTARVAGITAAEAAARLTPEPQ